MTLVTAIVLVLKASIFLNVLALGMTARPADAIYVLRHPGLLLRSLLAMNVLMPVFAVGLATAFNLHPVVKLALIALAVSPVPPMLPRRQLKAGARTPYTIGLLVAASLLSIVVIPITVTIIGQALGKEAHVPVVKLALIVVTSILAPLAVGLAIRRLAPSVAERLAKPIAVIAVALIAAVAVPILVSAWPEIVALIGDGTLAALAAFSIVGLAVGHWLGGPDPDERTVLALSTASRHPAVAMAIAVANFSNPKPVIAAALLYLIVGALISLPYIYWRTRRGGGVGGTVEARPYTPERALTIKRGALGG